MPLRHHTLVAWQRADDLFIEVHQLTLKSFPSFEKYELGSQVRRAAFSIAVSTSLKAALDDIAMTAFDFWTFPVRRSRKSATACTSPDGWNTSLQSGSPHSRNPSISWAPR
jgi:hypothetical protein